MPPGWESDEDSLPTMEVPAWRARQLRRQGDQGQAQAAQARRAAHQTRERAARDRRNQASRQQRGPAASQGTSHGAQNRQWRQDRQQRRRDREFARWNALQDRGAEQARARAQQQSARASHATSGPTQPAPTEVPTTTPSPSIVTASTEAAPARTPTPGRTSPTGPSEPDRDSGTASGPDGAAARQGQTAGADKAKKTRIRGVQHHVNGIVRFALALAVATVCLTVADLTTATGILAAAGAYIATADAGHRLNRWALDALEDQAGEEE